MKRAKKGELCFGTTDSWILWKLTGGKIHATDYTNASRTMIFNIRNKTWDRKLLKKLNIPESMLPKVKKSSSFFGNTIKIHKLPPGIPICGIAGDQQAALFGQACFEPGRIKNTYGTGAFMLLNTGKKFIISKAGLITTLGCGAKGEPVYVLEGAIFIAGAGIQWLRDKLKLLKRSSDSNKMAQAVKDNAGVYFVPAFVGLGAPYWDQNCRGAIFGLTRGTSAEHIVRSGLEAICFQTRDVVEAMQKDSGLSIKDLRVDGGASANDFLCQFQADILGIKVIRPKIIEITSWGAALLAGLSVGYWKSSKQIKNCWKIDKVFNPKMPAKIAAKIYAGWINAVNRTLS
jgi:glycerol kinase